MSLAKPYESVMTLLHAYNQMHLQFGLPISYDTSTTINTKRGVFSSEIPSAAPTIKYFGIGIGGLDTVNSDNNVSAQRVYSPSATDMDLFVPIPLRLRPLGDDLSSAERSSYRMRSELTIGGVTYIAYWLKKLTFPQSTIGLYKTDFVTGETSQYAFATGNLNPSPASPSADSVLTGSRVYAGYPVEFTMTGTEYTEVAAVYDVITNLFEQGTVQVSEIGFYSGIDVENKIGSDSTVYTEAIYTQLASHLCIPGIDLNNENTRVGMRHVFENGSATVTD